MIEEILTPEQILINHVRKEPKSFKFIPKHERTEDVCFEAAILDEDNLNYITLTESLIKRLIPMHSVSKSTILKLYDQSNEFICIALMHEYPNGLKYIRKQTEAICLTAVSKSAAEFYYVQEQTEKICRVALAHLPSLIEHVIDQTDELCRIAINKNSHSLKYIRNQTEEICIFAVNKDPSTILYVRNQTYNIILTAVKSFLNNNQKLTKYIIEGYIDWPVLTSDESEYIKLLL